MKRKIHKRFFILLLVCAGIFTAFKCYAAVVVGHHEWLSVRVMDASGNPIPGLGVSVDAVTEYEQSVSNEVCMFLFKTPGTYTITFYATGYIPEYLSVTVLNSGDGGVTIVAPIYMQRFE